MVSPFLEYLHEKYFLDIPYFMPAETADCYYFLYSVCKRGSTCTYRHNPLSKQCNILCEEWNHSGVCREDCPMRHSTYHLQKERQSDQCYWEDKGGCAKEFCEFRHKDPKKDEWKETKVKKLSSIRREKNERSKQIEVVDLEEIHKAMAEKKAKKEILSEHKSVDPVDKTDGVVNSPRSELIDCSNRQKDSIGPLKQMVLEAESTQELEKVVDEIHKRIKKNDEELIKEDILEEHNQEAEQITVCPILYHDALDGNEPLGLHDNNDADQELAKKYKIDEIDDELAELDDLL